MSLVVALSGGIGGDLDEGAKAVRTGVESLDPIQVVLDELARREFTAAKAVQLLQRGEIVEGGHKASLGAPVP